MNARTLILGLLPIVFVAAGCVTVPGTVRSQVNLFSIGFENEMGLEAWQAALQEATVIPSGPQARMVQRVGARVASAAERMYPDAVATFEWEFVLVDDPQMVNAWALPGGKSAVYTGLLPIAQDEAGLAVVMGHEVAHAVARHGGERMTHSMIWDAGLTLAQLKTGDMSPGDRDLLMKALGVGGQVLGILPYSRKHESEADHLGLLLSADAGYDPRAAIGLWERMASLGGERPPEFLSTHPAEATRIEALQALMPEALQLYNEARQQGR